MQEQTYALLGLREGDEAVGWQEAWLEAVRLSSGTANGDSNEHLSPFPEIPLSEEAGADFDRRVRAKLGSTSTPANADDHVALNTTLKPPPTQSQHEFAFNFLPKHTASEIDMTAGERGCISDGAASLPESVEDNLQLGDTHEDIAYSPPDDECGEAQRAVFAQHRAVTMKRLNRTPGRGPPPQMYHNQSSTLAVPASLNDDNVSLSRSFQHSGSLNDLPFIEESFGSNFETTLFEQVSYFGENV